MKKSGKIIALGWFLSVLLLFLYSFTQIDLGLTLTRASAWQPIQRAFQQIGYFRRPLSAVFYLLILAFLFTFYFLILKAIRKKWLRKKQVWGLIFLTAVLLWPAYNAFSYDLFNYMFDAKIVTFYQQNPYQQRALDFLGDPMLGFMHWTHRLYPYGPIWLAFTIPLSFLGFQKLIPTAILIKGLATSSYLGLNWFIYKVLKKTRQNQALYGLAVFAFSPFVLVEGLVSAHNDLLMMALALAGFWLLLKKKHFWAFVFLLLSIGIKFATVLLLPVFIWVFFKQRQGLRMEWNQVWQVSFWLMLMAILAAVKRDELKPWYLLYPFVFMPLLGKQKQFFGLTTFFSVGLLLYYAPFLYYGHWNPPVPLIKNILTIAGLIGGLFTGFCLSRKKADSF